MDVQSLVEIVATLLSRFEPDRNGLEDIEGDWIQENSGERMAYPRQLGGK